MRAAISLARRLSKATTSRPPKLTVDATSLPIMIRLQGDASAAAARADPLAIVVCRRGRRSGIARQRVGGTQDGIELYENVIDGAVLVVTAPAGHLGKRVGLGKRLPARP